MSKIKTIKLEITRIIDNDNSTGWRQVWKVLQVTDSIEFDPGQLLERGQADDLCASKSWRVTVNPGPFNA